MNKKSPIYTLSYNSFKEKAVFNAAFSNLYVLMIIQTAKNVNIISSRYKKISFSTT